MGGYVTAGPPRRTPRPDTTGHPRRIAVRRSTVRRITSTALAMAATAALTATTAAATTPPAGLTDTSQSSTVQVGACPADAVPAAHVVAGHRVGESSCQITGLTPVADVHRHPWTEASVAISGTAAGYVETTGAPRSDLVDYPRLLFPQFGDTAWTPATTTYSGATPGAGNGLSVLWPNEPASWNGQVVVLVPGQENVPPIGSLVHRSGTGLDPQTFTNLYAGPLIDDGYAVVYVRRQASKGLTATLNDGSTKDTSLNDNVAATVDWINTAEALLQHELGRSPSTVLWYGHSSGVIEGRIFNWSGANQDTSGHKIIDGFLSDDPGGGLPLPLDLPEGQLIGDRDGQITYPPGAGLTAAEKAQMTPELTLAHTEYTSFHPWTTLANYLSEKRAGQIAYQRQGLTGKERFDEVAGVSHIANQVGSPPNTLDLEGLVMAQIANLDAWVTQGSAPPPTIADLGGGNAQPPLGQAIDLPPIACPTGYRYGNPVGGDATETGYAPFDGHTLEPITSGGELVDVDNDGFRDAMPTLDHGWNQEGVWQAEHLSGPHHVTKAAFVACVQQDVNTLLHQHLLTSTSATWYVQQAALFPAVRW